MDEQRKVYIVTSGRYEAYTIEEVFSYESDAQDYVGRHNRDAGKPFFKQARIEAFILRESSPFKEVPSGE